MSPENVVRIGRAVGNRPRLLRIKFKSVEMARTVLRKKSSLSKSKYKQVIVRDDKTPRQLKHLQELREELRCRNAHGNKYTIKYIHNIPQIVESVIESSLN